MKEWGDVLALLSVFGKEGAAERATKGRYLALHYASAYSAPVAVVQALVRAYPASLDAKAGGSKKTPLEYARTNENKEVASVLHEAAARAAAAKYQK